MVPMAKRHGDFSPDGLRNGVDVAGKVKCRHGKKIADGLDRMTSVD